MVRWRNLNSEDAKSIMELPRFVQVNAAIGGPKPAKMQRGIVLLILFIF